MNLNKKITKFTGDGIPAYNAKFNELIDAVNWLAGIRTINGKPIAESDQGPILDLSQVSGTQAGPTPWALDPDGNQAGWTKITGLDFSGNITGFTNSLFDAWYWTGAKALNVRPIPWMIDPANNGAGWIVCTDNTFWGTGKCTTGNPGVNFQKASVTISPNYSNPWILTANPSAPPIVAPSSVYPRFYVLAGHGSGAAPGAPAFYVSGNVQTGESPVTSNWTYTITYDGVQVYRADGSKTFPPNDPDPYIYLPTAGWTYDPTGLAGYSQGQQLYIWEFNGAASTNTDPTVVEEFQFSAVSKLGFTVGIGGSYGSALYPIFITG